MIDSHYYFIATSVMGSKQAFQSWQNEQNENLKKSPLGICMFFSTAYCPGLPHHAVILHI